MGYREWRIIKRGGESINIELRKSVPLILIADKVADNRESIISMFNLSPPCLSLQCSCIFLAIPMELAAQEFAAVTGINRCHRNQPLSQELAAVARISRCRKN